MGKSFENSRYNTLIADNVAAVIEISTQLGAYLPQVAGRRPKLRVGMIMRKRSSHMPITTVMDAMVAVVIERSRLIPNKTNGTMKLQNTMSQKYGAKWPRTRDPKTFISFGSLPYQAVRFS